MRILFPPKTTSSINVNNSDIFKINILVNYGYRLFGLVFKFVCNIGNILIKRESKKKD